MSLIDLINHSKTPASSEWVQLALGLFGPGFKNIRRNDAYAVDVDALEMNSDVKWMMSPVKGARPGVFAGVGFQGLYGSAKAGYYIYEGFIQPAQKLMKGGPVYFLPNPNILKPQTPQGYPGRIDIR